MLDLPYRNDIRRMTALAICVSVCGARRKRMNMISVRVYARIFAVVWALPPSATAGRVRFGGPVCCRRTAGGTVLTGPAQFDAADAVSGLLSSGVCSV